MIPNTRFTKGMHRWMLQVFRAFDLGIRFFVLEWHRRARKTTLAINVAIRECCKNPNRQYCYLAPTYKQARNIVWDDPNMLRSYLPGEGELGWVMLEQKLCVKFDNGAILWIRGGDDPDSLRGIDAYGVIFDEWALIKSVVWFEIFMPIIEEKSGWAMFLFTPKGENHATEHADEAAKSSDSLYIHLDGENTGIYSTEELEHLKQRMPPALYDQEIRCRRITDEQRTVITSRMLTALKDIEVTWPVSRKIVSCDPSEGGDECPIKVFDNYVEIEQTILHESDTMVIVGHLLDAGARHQCDDYIVDAIGVGKGVVDRLRQYGKRVIAYKSSEASTDDRYANKRAEVTYQVADFVRAKIAGYPEDLETRKQIAAIKFRQFTTSGRVMLQSKQEIKKALGCSPDRGECWIMGIYGCSLIQEGITTKTGPSRRRRRRMSPMAA